MGRRPASLSRAAGPVDLPLTHVHLGRRECFHGASRSASPLTPRRPARAVAVHGPAISRPARCSTGSGRSTGCPSRPARRPPGAPWCTACWSRCSAGRPPSEHPTHRRAGWTAVGADVQEHPELQGLLPAEELAGWLQSAQDLVRTYFTLEDPAASTRRPASSRSRSRWPTLFRCAAILDRLDLASTGQLRVVDYKTGRSPDPDFEARALYQLKFYALMIFRLRASVPAQPPRQRPGLAGGALRLPPARLRGRLLAQPAPEGRRVRRLPVHRAPLPALRQARRAPERGRARPLRRARLPDHAAQRAAAAGRVPVRALPHARGPARAAASPRARATCSTRSSTTASTPRSRCCARWATSSSASRRTSSRAARGDRARHLQRQAGDHQLPQDRPPAARGAAATSSAPRRATSRTTSTSTSTTSTTPPSASGTCSRTTRRSVEALEDTNESVLSHRSTTSCACSPRSASILLPLTLIASIWGMNVGVPGEGRASRPSGSSSG